MEVPASKGTEGQGAMSMMPTFEATTDLIGIIDTGCSPPAQIGVKFPQSTSSQPLWTQRDMTIVRESLQVLETHEPLLCLNERICEIQQPNVTIPIIQDKLRSQIMQRLLLLRKLDSLQNSELHVLDLSNSSNTQSGSTAARRCKVPLQGPDQLLNSEAQKEMDTSGFACDECGKVLSSKWGLTCHKRIHLDIKPYGCSLCEYKSTQKSHLIQHYRLHTGERPYKCPLCDNAFRGSASLNHHIKVIHTGRNSLPCIHCAEVFMDNTELRTHRTICRLNSYKYSTIPKTFVPLWLQTSTGNGVNDQEWADQ